MQTYHDFQPTGFDCKGLGLPERQDWLVVPVSRNRDSGTLARSNFDVALMELGGESETVEVHRFGHWENGWFEIILAHPWLTEQVEGITASLEEYPILDVMHWSILEGEEAQSAWEHMSLKDRIYVCCRFGVSIFAARRESVPECPFGDIVSYLADGV